MSRNMQLSALKSGTCTGNLGHVQIFFKIGKVSLEFLHVPNFR